MPELFIPVAIFMGIWLGCGVVSLPRDYQDQTDMQRAMGFIALISFIFACGFAGALLASYVPPAEF